MAFLGFAAAFWSASGWRFSARLMPQTAATAGIIVIACAAIAALIARQQGKPPAFRTSYDLTKTHGLAEKTVYLRLGIEALWLGGLLLGVLTIGMLPAIALYVFLHMVTAGKIPWPTALIITASLAIGSYVLFVKLLHVPWPPSLLGDVFPDLRELSGRLL
jgi:hypothetical protein